MLAGVLELQILADCARLLPGLKLAQDSTASSMAAVERSINGAKRAFEALGVTLSAGAFVALIKGSIDAADHLNDLSKSTGIAVEQLAGLQLLAKQSGTDMDGLAKGVNKMLVEIGKSPEKFQALGVTAKDGVGALKQLADIFNLIPDIAQRNALAQAIFSKSWAELAPVLSEGSKKIGETIEKGTRLSAITKQMAKDADEFNDKMAELVGTHGLVNGQVAVLLPMLNSLAQDLIDLRDNSRGADGGFNVLLETFRALVVLGGNVAFTFRGIGREIGGIMAQADALGVSFGTMMQGPAAIAVAIAQSAAKDIGSAITSTDDARKSSLKIALDIGAQMRAEAEKDRAAFDAWQQKMMTMGTPGSKPGAPFQSQFDAMAAGQQAAALAAQQKAAQDRATAFLKEQQAAKDTQSEYDKLIKRIQERISANEMELALGRQLTDYEKFEAKTLADLAAIKGTVTAADKKHVAAMLERLKAADAELEKRKGILAVLASEIAARTALEAVMLRAQAITSDAITAAKDQIEQYTFETSLIGKTTSEILLLNAQRQIDLGYRRQLKALGDVYGDDTIGLAAAIAKLDAATATLRDGLIPQIVLRNQLERDWATGSTAAYNEYVDNVTNAAKQAHDAWTNAFKGMEDMLTNFFMTGKLDFKSFITLIEQQLARLAAQQFVINIAGNVTGGGSGIANGAVQGGTSALLGGGNILTGASSFLGAGASATMQNGLVSGFSANMANIGTLMEGGSYMTALSAAAPYLAVAAIAASVLSNVFGSKGGPKVTSGFGPDLNPQDLVGDPAQAKGVVDTLNAAYAQLAHTIGLANDKLNASVLISTDPKGDAQTILEVASASANYSRSGRLGGVENVGRSDEELKAALAEETTRLMFAALKQSNLSDLYKSWLDAVGDQAGVADMQAAIDHISKAASEKQSLEAQLFDLTATDAEKLAKARDAERAAVDESNRALLEQVYAQQDLKNAAQSATNALQEQTASLQIDLMRAQGNTAGADAAQRAIDIAGLSAADVAIYDYNQSIKAQIAAVNQATAIANQRASLETQIMQLTGDTAGLRAQELAALDASLRPLQERIYALQDEQAAAAKADAARAAAKARADAIASERNGLLQQLYQLQGNEAALRAMQLASLNASNRALQLQIYALQDQKDAAEKLKATWSGVTDSITQEVQRLRGLIAGASSQSFAQAQTALAIAMAQARAGDVNAAKALPGLSQNVSGLALQNSSSLLDYQRFISTQANSLESTGAAINGSLQIDVQPVVTEIQGLRTETRQAREEARQASTQMLAAMDRLDRWAGQWDADGVPPTRED